MALQTLDFGQFLRGNSDEQLNIAKTLVGSFKDHGFVKLVNHGIPDAVVKEYMHKTEKFFALPRDVKSKIANESGPKPQRGWSVLGSEQTSRLKRENWEGQSDPDALRDAREHFDAGPPGDDQWPNQWPDEADLPGFREVMEKFHDVFNETCRRIMLALEMGMELPPNTLLDRCRLPSSEIRLNHYPHISLKVLSEGKWKRTWPHTDFGIITLLFQDGVGGLEMEDRRKPGTFIPVLPSEPNAPSEMVVNVSDTLERWTNGFLKAGLHQVSVPSSLESGEADSCPDRISSVFFFKAHREASVGPLPQFITEKRPAAFDECTAIEFQRRMTQVLYSYAA
ncbi:Nn.00g017880.m01.CDS01 [Neocucurbitaria sp. VM-36]